MLRVGQRGSQIRHHRGEADTSVQLVLGDYYTADAHDLLLVLSVAVVPEEEARSHVSQRGGGARKYPTGTTAAESESESESALADAEEHRRSRGTVAGEETEGDHVGEDEGYV